MRRWLHGTCCNKMIYAMSSKIIFNEGRQAREEPSILKLPVNISTDRCRTRRCDLREGGGQLLNKPVYGVRPNNECLKTGFLIATLYLYIKS